jgi:Archaea-specific RecJ-like exonuclease, contains DnaJ-type Zn finger domain
MEWITHEEDLWFEFQGSSPDELTPGRFYRGTVDGFAEFGVFVDIAPRVTGLLHRSEIPQRLESLEWAPGDTVFVQVKGIRDNGNIDLAWSIRQRPEEFRGAEIDDPSGESSGTPADAEDTSTAPVKHTPDPTAPPSAEEPSRAVPQAEPATLDELTEKVDERVELAAIVDAIRQTGGPTIFELTDHTGTVDVAAFEQAGVRAYPAVEVGDVIEVIGEVEQRRGDLQVETEELEILGPDAAMAVRESMEAARGAAAEPDEETLLGDVSDLAPLRGGFIAVATAIRRAVIDERPVVIRHRADAPGTMGAAAIERAVGTMISERADRADAVHHRLTRRPLDDPAYDMDAATRDVTRLLEDAARHDEPTPLVVLVGISAPAVAAPGVELLTIYDVETVAVEATPIDAAVREHLSELVAPSRDEVPIALTDGIMGATLAAMIEPAVTDAVAHLPAASAPTDAAPVYRELASAQGYDEPHLVAVHQAISMEAFFQAYQGKPQLIGDLLFEDPTGDLVAHIAGQYEEKLETELRTAAANVTEQTVEGRAVRLLDAETYAHRFEFPPRALLAESLHAEFAATEEVVTVVYGTDDLYLHDARGVDLDAVTSAVEAAVPTAQLQLVDRRTHHFSFLHGARDAVIDAVVAATA